MSADRRIRTRSGQLFDPVNPRIRKVRIEDIAHALANQCRFSGHTRLFYSVAEHCVRVSRLVEDQYALAGLLHDASEAYCVDVPTPIKHHPKMKWYRGLEKKILEAIGKHFGVDWELSKRVIKNADQILYWTEARDLMGVDKFPDEQVLLTDPIVPWSSYVAKEKFLERFFELEKAG